MAKAFAKRIDPSLVPVQGTAIGKALEQALLAFSGDTEQSHGRVIILITDGENHEDDALAVAERAARQGIRIYTIGIGAPSGVPMPMVKMRMPCSAARSAASMAPESCPSPSVMSTMTRPAGLSPFSEKDMVASERA